MIIIQHRVNDLKSLLNTNKHFGVEIDVRSNNSELYLAHDPFTEGVTLRKFLEEYDHGQLVVNVKEDGLESACLELFERFGVRNYFFLDQPIPTLVRRGLRGFRDGACRISEFESIHSLLLQAPFCEWAWVDFFSKPQMNAEYLVTLRDCGLKLCIVSPEVHSFDREQEAILLKKFLEVQGFSPDAVCTKNPRIWS